MRARTYGINIRVTAQEKNRIERHAKKCGLTISEYLRKLAYGHTPNEIPSDNFYLIAHDLELMIQELKGKDDELLRKMLITCVEDLNDIYIYGKDAKQHGNHENLADTR